jgi:hypothetical protein
MKFPAIILSVYILVLTAFPCADHHISDNSIASVEFLEQGTHHSGDVDLCSPFCFCTCCQTQVQTTENNICRVNFTGEILATVSPDQNEINFTSFHWRPPQY